MSKSKLSGSDALGLANGGTNKQPKRPDQVARVTELIRQQILEGNFPAGHVMPGKIRTVPSARISRFLPSAPGAPPAIA